jgi:TonB family protein
MLASGVLVYVALAATASEETIPPGASCPGMPAYPSSEIPSQRRGRITVRISIDAAGVATDISVAAGMGQPFDDAALEAARKCTFRAASRDGKPVPSGIEMAVDFVPPPLAARIDGEVVGELGESLGGATVTSGGGASTVTEENGRFSIQLDIPDTTDVWFAASKPGFDAAYATQKDVHPGESRHIRLVLKKAQRYETKVSASRLLPEVPAVDRTPMVSHFEITKADIDRTEGALEDISRVVQTLPGVAGDPDLLATFFVRGGGPDEIEYYLDQVPLDNPFHLGGFASIYNPALIDSADFYAGGSPARYEPSLSGALDVRYISGETSQPHAYVDVSMNTAKAFVDSPTDIPGVSVLLSARRSYYELYFAGLQAAHIVGENFVAPDIGEYLARLNWRIGRQQITATYLLANDGLSFEATPGEQILVNFVGNLVLSNQLELGSVNDRIDLGASRELSITLAVTKDHDQASASGQNLFASDVTQTKLLGRADLNLPFSEQNRLRLGVQVARRAYDFTGQVQDISDLPPWAGMPLVNTSGESLLNVHPVELETILAAYAEDTWRPFEHFEIEGGMRVQTALETPQSTYALRVAASYELPTGTVAKLSFSAATQYPTNPLLLDPTYGNPALAPERSLQAVAGIEQLLPFGAFVRVEGWSKWLDHLAVNADSADGRVELITAGRPVFESIGSGYAAGVDAMLLGRTQAFSYGLSLGYLNSYRTNPLHWNEDDPSNPYWETVTYVTQWDQRFTGSAHVAWTPGDNYVISARFTFHTGRPYTPVESFSCANNQCEPNFGAPDSARYPPFYELSLRLEKRFRLGPVSMAWYAEVLNVTDAQNVFVYIDNPAAQRSGGEDVELFGANPANICSMGATETTCPAQRTAFDHLPIRPFLGIRAEY